MAKRLAFIALILSFPLWMQGGNLPRDDFSHRLQAIVRPYGFSLFRWEVQTLLLKLQQRVQGLGRNQSLSEAEKVSIVRQYYSLGDDWRRLQEEKQRLYAAADGSPDETELAKLNAEIRAVEEQRSAIEGRVEDIVGAQVSHIVGELGLREGLLTVQPVRSLPPIRVEVTPDVLFKYDRLPLLLVIAPRNRIEVKTSVFLQSHLALETVQKVEDKVDSLNVSSITTEIGGFAAYPSMIPETGPLQWTTTVIAHEWVHQYLAMRPLGFNYFSSYEMRNINETVADMIGQEIGQAVYDRYYAPAEKPAGEPAPPPPAEKREEATPRPDFGTRMREIRKQVEAYLDGGDVEGAERYMETERKRLVSEGFTVRKLNTAYLSFFGSYAGGGNPYEPGLRKLRERAGSLPAFVDLVEQIGSRQDFERVVGPVQGN